MFLTIGPPECPISVVRDDHNLLGGPDQDFRETVAIEVGNFHLLRESHPGDGGGPGEVASPVVDEDLDPGAGSSYCQVDCAVPVDFPEGDGHGIRADPRRVPAGE